MFIKGIFTPWCYDKLCFSGVHSYPYDDEMMNQLSKKRGISKEEAIEWFLKNERPNIVVDRRGKAP